MRKWTRREWRQVGAFYGAFFAITGVPCVALSVYLRSVDVFLGWVYFVLGFVALVGFALLAWTVTVWPLAMVLGKLLGGRDIVTDRDPDGPGFVV